MSSMWQQWLNALLGLWLVAFAFFGLGGVAFSWTLAISGLAVAVLGVWGAMSHGARSDRRAMA